jgi:L-iditol 2-dehydrogenase
MAMLTVKAASAPVVVVEPSAYRRQLAERLGADAVIDPFEEDLVERVMHHTGGQGATLVLECSSNEQAVASTLHVIGTGARVVLVGMKDGPDVPFKVLQIQDNQVSVIGSQGAPYFFPKVLAFMSRKAVNLAAVITHQFPLARVVEAFEMGNRGTESGKILIDCTQTD